MFDQPPQNLPTQEPVDILSGVEKDTSPAAPPPRPSAPSMQSAFSPPAMMPSEPPRIVEPFLTKGKIVAALVVVIVAVVGGIVAWIFTRGGEDAPATAEFTVPSLPVPAPVVAPAPAEPTTGAVVPSPVEGPPPPAPEPPPPADSDADGLTDIDEAQYGTDPQNADTDADGLTDREEIVLWKTDPRNSDSDGDTHPDGVEVANGYNPAGQGKLFEAQ